MTRPILRHSGRVKRRTGMESMRGLIGERLLKWFAGGFLRQPKSTPTTETEPEASDVNDHPSRSDSEENKEARGKEKAEHFEEADEMATPLHQ